MNAKPTLPQPSASTTTIVAALAAFIAVGLLGAVAFLFQREGAPMEQLAAAERTCTQHAYVSEREACMRPWLAVARAQTEPGRRDPAMVRAHRQHGWGRAATPPRLAPIRK